MLAFCTKCSQVVVYPQLLCDDCVKPKWPEWLAPDYWYPKHCQRMIDEGSWSAQLYCLWAIFCGICIALVIFIMRSKQSL